MAPHRYINSLERVACLYDIHGNLPALEAVLAEVRTEQVDAIAFGGDVVPGPMCGECIDVLFSCGIPVVPIRGNCEVDLLNMRRGEEAEVHQSQRQIMSWLAENLPAQALEEIASWPMTQRLQVDGLGSVFFCHGTPRHENEIFTPRTPEDRLLPVIEIAQADVVVCGHLHIQFDRQVGSTRVLNAGSIGMPFSGLPGADWLVLGPGVEFRHTDYDLDAATATMRATAYPNREDFIKEAILEVPDPNKLLDIFEPAALRGK